MALFALAIIPFMTACGTDRIDTGKSTALVLPPVIQYDGSILDDAAREVKERSCPALIELAKDYKLTRDRLRIAHEAFTNK